MSKTEVISASLRTELHSAQSANSQPKPNRSFPRSGDSQISTSNQSPHDPAATDASGCDLRLPQLAGE